jgi:elongation factor Tu
MNAPPPESRRTFPHDIEVELHFLPTAAGGKSKPTFSSYRAQFFYKGHDWDAVHTYPDVEAANPGETVRAFLGFLSPHEHLGRVSVGMPFLVREGGQTVAYGVVTRILDLEASARRMLKAPKSGAA